MNYLTLDEVKDQVSIERSRSDLDDRLTRIGNAAESWAANFLNASLADYEDSPVQSPPELPEDIKSALLLHVEWEFDRDAQLGDMILKRAHDLLWPHRVGLGI
jgi:hypothetical protein